MQVRRWLAGMSVGTMALAGVMAAGPLPASAQQNSTPPPAQSASQTAGEDDQATGPAVVGTPLLQPSIDLTRAQEIALEGQTGAVITEVGLAGEDGVLAYSIALDNGMEVDVDATSGEVLKTEQGDEENGENGDGEHENGSEGEENGSEQG
jgi:Peptidase propeptide and YPEB domain